MPVTRAALDAASRAALRAVLSVRPDANAISEPAFLTEHTLSAEPALLAAAESLEPDVRAPIPVGPPEIGFDAFLDGTQRVRILAWLEGVPCIFGVTGAVIRERVERRLRTWKEPLLTRSRLYVPLAYLREFPPPGNGFTIEDTTADRLGSKPSRHPAALTERAILCVQRDREALEQRLAEAWVGDADGVLCVDGSLPPAGPARGSNRVVGVIKSHRTLYAEGTALDRVLSLKPGERSPAFRVATSGREPVASWYLRLRDGTGRDALWAIVRLEIALGPDVSERADFASRWLLAENAPLALPDSRWDKMTYGVRDCESFLRAVS